MQFFYIIGAGHYKTERKSIMQEKGMCFYMYKDCSRTGGKSWKTCNIWYNIYL